MFLYYLLKYSKDKIENLGSGTTFKEISGSTMRGIEVFVPEAVEEQRRIASILSMLDDKIEKNIAVKREFSGLEVKGGDINLAGHELRQQ